MDWKWSFFFLRFLFFRVCAQTTEHKNHIDDYGCVNEIWKKYTKTITSSRFQKYMPRCCAVNVRRCCVVVILYFDLFFFSFLCGFLLVSICNISCLVSPTREITDESTLTQYTPLTSLSPLASRCVSFSPLVATIAALKTAYYGTTKFVLRFATASPACDRHTERYQKSVVRRCDSCASSFDCVHVEQIYTYMRQHKQRMSSVWSSGSAQITHFQQSTNTSTIDDSSTNEENNVGLNVKKKKRNQRQKNAIVLVRMSSMSTGST